MGVPLRPVSWIASLLLLLALVATARGALAASETYRGMLVPENRSPPIPISVELDMSRRQLSGKVSTSTPLTGEGRVVSGEKNGYDCNFKSDIGVGRTLTITGFCLSTMLEGRYTLRMLDGSLQNGDLRLMRAQPEKSQAKSESDDLLDQSRRTVTGCLTLNTACLAACPRGDYNAEFICASRCRQRLTGCKAKANRVPHTAP
jgi:hypothetical protein